MHRNMVRGFLLMAAVAVTLAGCGTLSIGRAPGPAARTPGPTQREVPSYRNGQVVNIQGKVVLDKNEVMIEDQDSPVVFKLVGLQPGPKRTLTGLAGRLTRVQLKVISTQSARACNAQFIQFNR